MTPMAPPKVTLVLTPDSIPENGGSSTVTATLAACARRRHRHGVGDAVAPAVEGDFTLSATNTLTFHGRADGEHRDGHDHGQHNDVHAPDKRVTVSGVAASDGEVASLG